MGDSVTAAADGSHMSGAMIALMPTTEDAERLAAEGGEAADQLHVTLRYLGKGADFDEASRAAIVDSVRALAEGMPPVTSKIFGVAHWNSNGDEPSWVWSVGDDPEHGQSLEAAQGMAEEALLMAPMDVEIPAPHTPWVAHLCAAYSDQLDLIIALEERLGPVTFDRVRVAFAGDHTDIPLSGNVTAAAGALRRPLTETELRSGIDFARIQSVWEDTVDAAVDSLVPLLAAQREQITFQVRGAAQTDNMDGLNTLSVDDTGVSELLFRTLVDVAQAEGEAQQAEAEAQGVSVPEWTLSETDSVTAAVGADLLRSVARVTARIMSSSLVQSAVRRALSLFGQGRTPDEVADGVSEHLSSLSEAGPRDSIGAAVTAAQAEGRRAVLAVAPAGQYFSSEILDRSTCAPCRSVDGTQFETLADANAAYPSGTYRDCLGLSRCRGQIVTVWSEQALSATASAAAVTSPLAEGEHMPWRIEQGHPDCPGDSPWAVVKEEDGTVEGCHATQSEAQDQLAALNAAEEDMPESMDYEGQTAPWSGPLAVEGIFTGDGREFAPGSLTWADLPVPLRWNKEDSHGGEPHTVAVNVGRIDRIWRDGEKIMGEGVLNLGEEDGRRVYELIKGKFLRGVSIDADSISGADVEFVWPDDDTEGVSEDAEPDIFEMLFAQPEKMIFKAGRIRAATLVDIPAFSEAYIALLDDTGAVIAGGALVTAEDVRRKFGVQELGAVGTHGTATSDGPWDAGVHERRLPSPLTVDQARAAYAWYDGGAVEDGELPKSAAKFLHHETSEDGSAGAANLTACSATIGALHGARGTTPDIPDADRRGVYDHVAAHLRDADMEPEPFRSLPSVAASASIAVRPPATWFADPGLSVPTPITVSSQGRIYGHAAQWGQCHVGFADQCISPPREDTHPYFMTGETVCEDGKTVSVGQVTVGTGHAPLSMGAPAASQHYDHTGWAVADVAVGNDAHGIWVAGAIRPGADANRVHELRASGQVSGDWRRIGGQLRLVGLLAVNVPGFPVPKMRARVASGAQYALVAAGKPSVAHRQSPEMDLKQAYRVLMNAVRDRVHQGGE